LNRRSSIIGEKLITSSFFWYFRINMVKTYLGASKF